MTKRTARVQITLAPEVLTIFRRISIAQKRPMTKIIAEFLGETAPALQNVLHVVEMAANAVKTVGKNEREAFQVAEAELLQHASNAMAALDGVESTFAQLALELGGNPAQSAAPAAGAQMLSPQTPQRTNRGVNSGKKSKNDTGGSEIALIARSTPRSKSAQKSAKL